MRIFVSSSFEDLREHRATAIRVLRQLGHEVIAIGGHGGRLVPAADQGARDGRPQRGVRRRVRLAVVGTCRGRSATPSRRPSRRRSRGRTFHRSKDAHYGQTSITHYEYLRARERDLPILAFLLADDVPLNPVFVDGFDRSRPGSPLDASHIRALRAELQEEKVVSWFTTPSDLEARVATAVTVRRSRTPDRHPAGHRRRRRSRGRVGLRLRRILRHVGGSPSRGAPACDPDRPLQSVVVDPALPGRRAAGAPLPSPPDPGRGGISPRIRRRPQGFPRVVFIGTAVHCRHRPRHRAHGTGARTLPAVAPAATSRSAHSTPRRLRSTTSDEGWASAFMGGPPAGAGRRRPSVDAHEAERAVKIDLTRDRLRQWFGDAMLEQPVEVRDPRRASVVDLIRVIDYPNDFVPVLSDRLPNSDEPVGVLDVIDKAALTHASPTAT